MATPLKPWESNGANGRTAREAHQQPISRSGAGSGATPPPTLPPRPNNREYFQALCLVVLQIKPAPDTVLALCIICDRATGPASHCGWMHASMGVFPLYC